MKTLAFIPLIAVLGCTEFASPTQPPAQRPVMGGQANAALILNERDDIVSFPVTACNGEPLLLDGTVHFMFNLVGPRNGTSLMTWFSADYQLRGTGSVTGAKYEASQKFSAPAGVTPNDNVSSTDVFPRAIHHTNLPNSLLPFL